MQAPRSERAHLGFVEAAAAGAVGQEKLQRRLQVLARQRAQRRGEAGDCHAHAQRNLLQHGDQVIRPGPIPHLHTACRREVGSFNERVLMQLLRRCPPASAAASCVAPQHVSGHSYAELLCCIDKCCTVQC